MMPDPEAFGTVGLVWAGMKLGVFGGTFDPIHSGHLHMAQQARRVFGFTSVHLVVAGFPPHKSGRELLSLHHRFAMVALATQEFPCLVPSLIELEHPASPFSIDTLGKLERRLRGSGTDLYFIAGADSLLEVSGWRAAEALLTRYNVVFVSRPGVEIGNPCAVLPRKAHPRVRDLRGLKLTRLRRTVRQEDSGSLTRIFLVDLHALDVSSSEVRRRATSGRRVAHLTPPAVRAYIKKLHLYGA